MAESIFQNYLNRLTDLSSKNRSLYLAKLEGSGFVDIRDLDFLDGRPAFEIVRQVIQGKNEIPLIPEVDPRMGEANQLSKSLSRIAFRDQLTREETGDRGLYLAWPFVEGKLINGQIVRAPLLLTPISLLSIKGKWHLVYESSWEWNPAFLLAYRHAYKKEIDSGLFEEELQNLSLDPTEFRVQVSKLLSENFSIQLSSALFEDQILGFPSSQISLDQGRFEDGKLALKTYAVLGQFSQKSSFLFRDYESLISNYGDLSLEELFVKHFESEKNPPNPREEQMFPVFPLDASQEAVLFSVRKGVSLVVEGPPGTGKSQLIANLISDYIARGKKVLVVSQKRAALDVVFERMEKAGFGDFLALVHDFRGDQSALFEKLRSQIEAIESYQEQNRGIDSIQLERDISRLSMRIGALSTKFEEMRKELFNEKPAGIPIKAMYLKARLDKPALNSPTLLNLDYERTRDFESGFRIFDPYHQKFSGGFWDVRRSFSRVEPADFDRIRQCLQSVEKFRESTPRDLEYESWANLINSTLNGRSISEPIFSLLKSLDEFLEPESILQSAFQKRDVRNLKKVQEWLRKTMAELAELEFGVIGDCTQLEGLSSELTVLVPKAGSFFRLLMAKWKKSKFPLTFGALAERGVKVDLHTLERFEQEVKVQLRLLEEFRNLPATAAFKAGSYSFESFQLLLAQSTNILNWIRDWEKLASIHELTDWGKMSLESFRFKLLEVGNWLRDFEKAAPGWNIWLESSQIIEILDRGLSGLSLDSELGLNQAFVELSAFDSFLSEWGEESRSVAMALENQFGELALEEKLSAFRNGWCLAWIGELERRNPVLAEAGSLKLSAEMAELKDAILEKRKIAKYIALLRLREQVSFPLEYNRLGNRLTYRDLYHQVSKKRQRWPIRKLVEEMESEVLRLLPCWLASPETVSAIFPIGEKFDLVIFDEASQCQVERGLPAMLRGRQVVVAGDSKQLRPSDFYQLRWEGDEEGMEYEAESLLELAGWFFQKHQLKGHYRSADPALIYFSNLNFYGNQLETLPDYQTVQRGACPFSWEKTEGIWENQVNKTEAEAVVEKVRSIRLQAPGDSIGIVTGNYFQMELIRDRLWSAGTQDGEIKVRNIENVQGDEFDQVILSLGYAPNREGKLATNFGLLAKSGAENRLNVAITRARKKMHVISSIAPEDFRPGQIQNSGLASLREFLVFARSQSNQRSIAAPEVISKGFEIEWSLKKRLLEKEGGFSAAIPSSVMDLVGVSQGVGVVMAILTDDQRFFKAPTAKAVMAYHPILLEQKGWSWQWKWSRVEFFDIDRLNE
ncbi:DUF4011 domain-containing protein [Algoriphagus aestuariicola]|uniref:DUF4011 domain-containing protein n=1 Tax=Algoriphagus aestuariicola TaxID=1852016 RepID=A0ABS3BRS2_9BACT|nr:AAA domain-containing protein [Algoriphagus aestuariicola]MBN7801586.1 DUF4011 domain-containing protein [Algoriphagus aestuariicola]